MPTAWQFLPIRKHPNGFGEFKKPIEGRQIFSGDGSLSYAVAQEVVNEVGDISAGNAVDRNVLFLLAGFQPLHKLPVKFSSRILFKT